MTSQARASGIIPKALANRPTLNQFTQPYFNAYTLLRRSRTWTAGGPADIPLNQIILYLDENKIDDWDERSLYIQMIYALDDTYLENYSKKVKTNG